jgi:hypothetical protein
LRWNGRGVPCHDPFVLRLLLGTTFLNCLTGSELLFHDLAVGLQGRGHEVTAWVKELNRDAPLPRLLHARDIPVSAGLPDEGQIDAVIFQLKETFPFWREHFLDVPRFAICHGPKLPAEIAPPDLPNTTHLALTREGLAYLRRHGYSDAVYIGYGVDLRRFAPPAELPDRPRRAVVHSKYGDGDVVSQACERLGIEVTELGVQSWKPGSSVDHYSDIVEVRTDGTVIDHDPQTAAWHVEDILAPADIVFGMGRSAVEALAMGKACFVYGYGPVGDGMVTADRLDAFANVNFSGRAWGRTFNINAMVEELRLYSVNQGRRNRRYAVQHYDLVAFLDRVDDQLRGCRPLRRRRLASRLQRLKARE